MGVPLKPLTNKEVRQYIDRLKAQNAALRNKVAVLEADSNSIKANNVIVNFKNATKAELQALTVAEQRLVMFRVLKALCYDALDD